MSDGRRVTVAHVNYSFFHSTQSFVYFYLAWLRRVHPICLTRGRESPVMRSEIPAALDGDFYIYSGRGGETPAGRILWRAGFGVRRALTHLPPAVAEAALRVLNGRVVPRVRPDADPRRFLAWAEAIVRARDARLIHAYFGPVAWRMLELKRRVDAPLVVTFLGDDIAPTVNEWWSWWIRSGDEEPDWPTRMREVFAGADLFLAEGPFMRGRLVELGCPPEKVRIQHIAIPVAEMPFRARRPRPGERAIAVFAGRFCEQKGVLFALDAMRRLRDAGRDDIELRLIGDDTMTDGSYAARVHAFIREHRLSDRVRLLGFLNHDAYLEALQEADLFVHPSVVDDAGRSEGGAPTTILEAQALGMPVVSTLHCDIPNVTLPGESALLVPERDGEALAGALASLLDDPARWEAMGRAGRRLMEENHDIAREAPKLEDLYSELLGGAVS